MKKIIYSLVIMIAAGSLFTSCIEQVEPLGIQDMRFAKAEYIRALKDLRAADAELVRAEAAHELARARYVDAMTANLNADTEYQKLLNEYQQLINEARQDTNDFIAQKTASAIDSIKKEMELRELTHAKAIADAEKDLAFAREQLRVALRDIALYSQSLTPAEQSALAAAVYMYETAFEETADQTMVVMQAQRTLDSLKLVRQVGPDTVYDKSSKAYIGSIEKWKKDIEEKELDQAVVAALLLAVPDSLVYDDVDGWKAQIDQLSEDSTTIAYNKYQVKTEMASYYTAYIHDNVAYFDTVTSKWMKDHPKKTYTAAQKKLVEEGEKTQADFMKTPLVDSIEFDPFVKSDEITQRTFNKFAYLLNSFVAAKSPYSASEPKTSIIDTVKTGINVDTIFIVGPVRQKLGANMKSFLMGAEGNGEGSQKYEYADENGKKQTLTANYGLRGAYSILERELVTYSDPSKDPEKLLKAMNEADSTWEAHRQILIDGVEAYVPFQEAEEALVIEEELNGQGAQMMVQAVKDLKAAIAATHTGFAHFDGNDSLALFNAIIEFAQARELYLNYTPKDAAELDSNVFYYSAGKSGAGKYIPAAKYFSNLTFEELRAIEYELVAKDPGDTKYIASITGPDLTTADTLVNAFAHIVGQMGPELSSMFKWSTHEVVQPTMGSTPLSTALYGAYMIDSWDDPTKIMTVGGAVYEPEDLKEAKGDVMDAINDYIKAYNDFWAMNVPAADTTSGTAATELKNYFKAMDEGDDDAIEEAREKLIEKIEAACDKSSLNPECYTLATFKPFADEAPIVTYVEDAAKIDKTDAMKAVLTAVDPNAATKRDDNTQWDSDTFENKSAIFKGGATDFAKFMKAAYEYYEATNEKVKKDLEVVKKWIDDVEQTFVDDATEGPDVDKYNQWKTDYAAAKAAKPAYETYIAALKEFTGKETQEPITLTAPTVTTSPNDFTAVKDVLVKELVKAQDVFGIYPGEWNAKLGGKQLEMAKELFPDYPTKLKEWDEEIKDTEEDLTHIRILMTAAKEAYFAAAKIAGENVNDATNWDQLVENYKKANENYRKRLVGIIEKLQGEIETLEERIAKFNQGLPQLDIAIAEAEKELKVETARLQGYEQALAYAKANLDKILEYIKSLDVNFVVPAVDFDD